MKRMQDCQSEGMHSTKNSSPVHQTFPPRVRGTALALLGVLGLWLFPIPSSAPIPDSVATVGPAAHLALPRAVRVATVGDHTMNDPTAPPQEVPFLPTMDQSVYDALKAEAGATLAPGGKRATVPLTRQPTQATPPRLDKNFEGVNQTLAFGPGSGFIPP